MAVVINEFEVVAEPPAQASDVVAAPPPPPGPPAQVTAQVIRMQRERAARVRAH